MSFCETKRFVAPQSVPLNCVEVAKAMAASKHVHYKEG